MFAPRTATGLTIALLALPATATAKKPALPDSSGGGAAPVLPNPDQRADSATSSFAGTTSPQDFRNPDGADAARAGDIAKAMEHYERSLPATVAAKPASTDNDAPAWPEIAFAGVVLLTTVGGVVRVRGRQRVAA